MSYDTWLEIDTGGPEPVTVEDVGNVTWNLSPMLALALGSGIRQLDGRLAGDVTRAIDTAVARMDADPAPYKALEPANGWGTYEGAMAYLKRLLRACRASPRATIRVI